MCERFFGYQKVDGIADLESFFSNSDMMGF